MDTNYIIILLSYLPVLIVGVYSLKLFRSAPELRVFAWLPVVAAVNNTIMQVLWLFGLSNLLLVHIYVPVSTVLILWFYKQLWKPMLPGWIFPATLIAFCLYSVWNSVFYQGLDVFNSHALTAQAILVVVLSLSTYGLLMNDSIREEKTEVTRSLNWINSGLFIYYVSALILFYFGELIMHALPAELSQRTWLLHSLFSTVMYVCFFLGIWKRPKPSTSSTL